MKTVAIIGGGVSGLTCAQLLKDRFAVSVYEREVNVGGLIRCERINGSLFHICGGHVFNTHNQKVAEWFWSKFNKDRDFIKADRRAAVCLDDGRFVDYPIENHVYQLPEQTQRDFIADIREMVLHPQAEPDNFAAFLLCRFGRTLYDLYFRPYNQKVWRRDLSNVPLSWLAGKLPMPTVDEMLLANMNHSEERQFVHSTFYYEKNGGSQFIADTLSHGVNVKLGCGVGELRKTDRGWFVDGQAYDAVIFSGNVKDLPGMIRGFTLEGFESEIQALDSHGTTAVFCETDPVPYSWFYQPSSQHQSHRFICTGNFSPANNAPGKMTCTVEFTDVIDVADILRQLTLMPYNPRYITHHYSAYTYPVQNLRTREMVEELKKRLRREGVFLCGRFAEWEYFNMDAAMASAMSLCEKLK